MAAQVDFDEVKARVSMAMVLGRYGLLDKARETSTHYIIRCPFHENDAEPSCKVEKARDIFHCFGCDAGGDVIDFVKFKEGIATGNRNRDRRQAALKLQEWFVSSGTPPPERQRPTLDDEGEGAPTIVNPPLPFRLKNVDDQAALDYATGRGFAPETVQRFGLTVARSGGYKGRVVIPLHNEGGILIGYAARSMDDGEPKYLMPSREKHFYKSHLLFNLHRVLARQAKRVIVTEGFFDCMRITEAGLPAVAICGTTMSGAQANVLCADFEAICLMFDGDAAGRAGIEAAIPVLGRRRYVRYVELPDGVQPDALSSTEIVANITYMT